LLNICRLVTDPKLDERIGDSTLVDTRRETGHNIVVSQTAVFREPLTAPLLSVTNSFCVVPRIRVNLRSQEQCTIASLLGQAPLGIGDRGLENCPSVYEVKYYEQTP